MVIRYKRIPALLATAFTGAVLAINVAQPAENQPNLELPTDPLLLVQEKDKKDLPPKAPEAKIPEAKSVQPEPAVPSAAASVAPTSSAAAAASAAPSGGFFGSAGGSTSSTGVSSGAANPSSTTGGSLSASQQSAPTTSSAVVGGGEATARASTDLGDLLGKSISSLGVEVHHRSPIISEPFIRGYHIGQYATWADGGYWFPARQDLDTIVSKIDSTQIENVVIIKGPYSVRYGPGFSFLDVETLATPRYQDGFQMHGSSSLTYKTNGQQWFGLQSIWGGAENYGFRATYNIGTGEDYRDGAGVEQPSSFNTQTFNFDYGFNVGRYNRFEIKTMHVQQTNVEIPGAFFDINLLTSDAFTGRYIYDDKDAGKFTFDTWYNFTNVHGDNLRGSKRAQIPVLTQFFGPGIFAPFFGTAAGDVSSAGYRAAFTLGGQNQPQITLGTDLVHTDSQQNEFGISTVPSVLNVPFGAFSQPVPHAYSNDPGLFIDFSLPLADNRFLVKTGLRYDWDRVAMSDLTPPGPQTFSLFPVFTSPTAPADIAGRTQFAYIPGVALTGDDLRHTYRLWTSFITTEWKINDNISLLNGFGYAQRPPTMTELYALNSFMGVMQRSMTFVKGNPLLAPETLKQVDVGLKANYEKVRAGVNAYYAWVHNYITYQNFSFLTSLAPGFENFGYSYVNTDEAILAGGEAYGEWDATPWLTGFATLATVTGRDLTRNDRPFIQAAPGSTVTSVTVRSGGTSEPLPNIPPLDARVGFRIHQAVPNPRWGMEFTTRIVDAQDQVATTLHEFQTPGYTLYDVRGFWKINDNVLVTSGVENIGDKNYREWADFRTALGVLQPGINYYLTLRLTY